MHYILQIFWNNILITFLPISLERALNFNKNRVLIYVCRPTGSQTRAFSRKVWLIFNRHFATSKQTWARSRLRLWLRLQEARVLNAWLRLRLLKFLWPWLRLRLLKFFVASASSFLWLHLRLHRFIWTGFFFGLSILILSKIKKKKKEKKKRKNCITKSNNREIKI